MLRHSNTTQNQVEISHYKGAKMNRAEYQLAPHFIRPLATTAAALKAENVEPFFFFKRLKSTIPERGAVGK